MSDRRDYYDRAESWANDARAAGARSRRTAWTVAGIAVAAAAFEAVALAMLAPLKSVEPITLLVDRQTGYVQALDPLTPRRVGADAALTDAYLAQYVTAREGFDRATVRLDYRKVGLWSASKARTSYLAMMASTNPASPFQAYPAGTSVTVRIKSVSRLSQGISLVRFDTQLQVRDGRQAAAQPWISVVRFRYVDAPMSLEDRLVNPLGFQVTGYRRDAEAPPPSIPTPASSPPPASPISSSVAPAIAPNATPRLGRAGAQSGPVSNVVSLNQPSVRDVPVNQIPSGSPLGPLAGAAPPIAP